jgi:hypothetical protein
VKVCDVEKDHMDQNSQPDNYDFDCGNGRSASVDQYLKKLTYNAPDGFVTMDMALSKTGYHADTCAGEPQGRGDVGEAGYQNGQCASCPVHSVCGDFSCGFDGKCK